MEDVAPLRPRSSATYGHETRSGRRAARTRAAGLHKSTSGPPGGGDFSVLGAAGVGDAAGCLPGAVGEGVDDGRRQRLVLGVRVGVGAVLHGLRGVGECDRGPVGDGEQLVVELAGGVLRVEDLRGDAPIRCSGVAGTARRSRGRCWRRGGPGCAAETDVSPARQRARHVRRSYRAAPLTPTSRRVAVAPTLGELASLLPGPLASLDR